MDVEADRPSDAAPASPAPRPSPTDDSSAETMPSLGSDLLSKPTPAMITRRIVFWIGICSISAAPSMAITLQDLSDFPLPALILGILTFAILAGVLTSLPSVRRLTRRPRLRRSIITAYALRTIFAVIPMAPVIVDIWVGLIALGTGQIITYPLGLGSGEPSPFGMFLYTYIMVIWQGVLLNILVWLLVLIAWLFQKLFMRAPADPADGGCPKCGYDLRSTEPGRPCPECGDPKLARCADCGLDLATVEPSRSCPSCGSTRGTIDPRWRSWIDRVSPVLLLLLMFGGIAVGTIMSMVNEWFL